MANLKEIAELSFRALFPEPREKTSITLEEFIATAKTEYAASMWIYRMEQIAAEGWFDMNSGLLSPVEKEVVDNKIDISDLNYLNGLPGDLWLQNVGGLQCECKYIKTTINLSQLLCEDDSGSDSDHPYYVQGKSIIFPKGTHAKTLTIIYANTGGNLDEDEIEVDDYVASKVRLKLMQLYGNKMPVDDTNNQNPDK